MNDYPIAIRTKDQNGNESVVRFVNGPTGLLSTKETGGDYFVIKDHIGSSRIVLQDNGAVSSTYNYLPMGGLMNSTINDNSPYRFQGQEYDPETGLHNFRARFYDDELGRFYGVDPQGQFASPYVGIGNNPVNYVDPDGEFVTWSINNGGFSIGINLTPIGIPVGTGINVGWGDGFSLGRYDEVGWRVGGTGLGAGATVSQSYDYNFRHKEFSTTTSLGAYGSAGPLTVGGNVSGTYNFRDREWSSGWGVYGGLAIGDEQGGIGLTVGYGSSGWSYGLSGYHNPWAWQDNPSYSPEDWNDNAETQYSNNCYSYACNDPDNHPLGGKPQPGEASGQMYGSIDLDEVGNAAIRDGLKKPNLWNKLGYGKRGYYKVYLVVDVNGDYHWYRQDKGGSWSHKPGHAPVRNVGPSGNPIRNPARISHNYGYINYNDGGIFLWKKSRR